MGRPKHERRERAQAAEHPHPRRHRLHRAGAGGVRDHARPLGDAAQSQPHAARLLQGARRAADRRSECRRERAQGQEVRRRDRQPDDAAGVGAQRRAVHEGQHEALHLHLDGLGLRERQEHVGRRKRSDGPMPAGLDPYTLDRRPVAARTTVRSRRSRRRKSRSTIRESTRSFVQA